MWKPQVSVVMCTYNGADFLHEQMDSILAQSYPLTEFLIFDDGSSDATVEIIESYQEKHPVIILRKNEVNLGYNLNFQKALEAASSEVIAIADQDDVWHHLKIERMVTQWNEPTPIIYCDSQKFEHVIPKNNRYKHLYQRFAGTNTKQLFIYNTVSGHAMLLRKSFLPLILPFQQDIYYDWWAAVVASCNGGITYVDEILVFQRMHNRNVSVKKGLTDREQFTGLRELVSRHVKKFATAPNLNGRDKKLAVDLYDCMITLDSRKKRKQFFWLILKNRKTIFYYKRRKVGIISHLKYALKLAFY